MFNKKIIESLQENINELKREFTQQKYQTEKLVTEIFDLKTEIFELKHPNGLLGEYYSHTHWNSMYKYSYVYKNEIKNVLLCNVQTGLKSYKNLIDGNKVYIGLKFKDSFLSNEHELYFVIDMENNTSIECTDSFMVKEKEWVEV